MKPPWKWRLGFHDLTWFVLRQWDAGWSIHSFLFCPGPFAICLLWRVRTPVGGYSRKGGE